MVNAQASVYAVESKLAATTIVSYLKSWIPFAPFFLIINTNGERALVEAFNHLFQNCHFDAGFFYIPSMEGNGNSEGRGFQKEAIAAGVGGWPLEVFFPGVPSYYW